MSGVDPNSNLARRLREAGHDPDQLAALPPEEKIREGEQGVKGLPDPHNEHAHASNRAELGTGPLQRESVKAMAREVELRSQPPLTRRIQAGKPGTSELRPSMGEGSRNRG